MFKQMAKIGVPLMFLLGCITSTQVLPYGPDTYTISTRAYYRTNAASRGKALREASNYCAWQGKVMSPVSENTRRSRAGEWGLPGTDFVFSCVTPR